VKGKNDVTDWDRRGNAVASAGADGGQAAGDDFRPTGGGLSMGNRAMTRYGGVMAVAVLLSPGAVVHHPVHEVQVVASKFMFEPSTIEVPAGEPVRLVIRSKDTVHGFSVPTLKIDVQIPKSGSEPVTVEFVAPPPGRFEIACSEFCGLGHGHMKAALISLAPLSDSN
jgi:heme/copper-type cytochrome/quinol oxidase subunit 2